MSRPIIGNRPPPRVRRPVCAGCKKPRQPDFRPIVSTEAPESSIGPRGYNAKEWRGEYEGYGYFCTMRCAVTYANQVVNAQVAGGKIFTHNGRVSVVHSGRRY
jgi:hypothetical protein